MGKGTLLATRGAFGLGDLGAGVLEQRNVAAQMPPGPGQLPALKHKLLGNLPGEPASSKVAVARGLLVDGLLQIQVPARPQRKGHFSGMETESLRISNSGVAA